MSEQCSDIFGEAFDSGCGGCVHDCCCGVTHFDGYNHYDWEKGELESLQERAKERPEKYMEHDGSIGYMEIDGREIVYGCTCKWAKQYENFIINHSRELAEYLNKRAKAMRKTADEMAVEL